MPDLEPILELLLNLIDAKIALAIAKHETSDTEHIGPPMYPGDNKWVEDLEQRVEQARAKLDLERLFEE